MYKEISKNDKAKARWWFGLGLGGDFGKAIYWRFDRGFGRDLSSGLVVALVLGSWFVCFFFLAAGVSFVFEGVLFIRMALLQAFEATQPCLHDGF